jgi:heme exporter protein D
MMPELDRYAATVLGAYAVTLALIVLLVGLSVWRAVRVKRQLARAEAALRETRDATP